MLADDLRQMRGNNGRRIHYGVAQALRTLSLSLRDPDRRQMKGGLKSRNTRDLLFYVSGIHRHIMVKQDLAFANLNSLNLDNILVRIQLNVITQSDDRHHCTKFQCDLSSYHNNTV